MTIRKKAQLGRRESSQRVPRAFQNHLTRLFGAKSRYSKSENKSPSEWRKILKALLVELDRYRQANVRADQLHEMLLREALRSAEEALKSQDFWPGYAEGLARFALLLMGDYPDHHRRKGGKRRNDHYKLDLQRTFHYSQDAEQQFRTVLAASQWKWHKVPHPFLDMTGKFRDACGYQASSSDFMNWFKREYPEAYAALF